MIAKRFLTLIVLMIISCVYPVVSLLYLHKTDSLNRKTIIEHFKKKKKGKKGLSAEAPEIDIDEIISKVEESKEEEEEPPEEEPDPEDEDGEGYVSEDSPQDALMGGSDEAAEMAAAGGGGDNGGDGGDDGGGDGGGLLQDVRSTYVPPQRQDSAPRKESVVRSTIQAQKKLIAAEPDYIFSDILYFKRVVPYTNKKLICVIPNKPKHLYIIKIEGEDNSTALLVGSTSADVLLNEAKPKGIDTIKVYDPSTSYDDASIDCQYLIFYDYSSPNHPFWKWLNNRADQMSFVEYFGAMPSAEDKQALLTQYPYFRINTNDVKKLLPGKSLHKQHIHTIMVDSCVYSNKPFKDEFYNVYDRYHGQKEYQTFYELFFPYYNQIIRSRLGVDPSTKLKETFVVDSKTSRILIKINEQLKSLESVSFIRDAFKELTASKSDFDSLNVRVARGDKVRIANQIHRTLEGDFYIVDMKFGRVLLQSRWLIQNVVGLKMMSNVMAVASHIDYRIAKLLHPYDLVFLKDIDAPAIFVAFDRVKKFFFFSVTDDVVARDKLYQCVTQPKILHKNACISAFDDLGIKKPEGPDVWDRPCMYDEECAFFGKGKWSKFRGGCQDSGYCEMPVGFFNVGYRHYAKNEYQESLISESQGAIRFTGDVFEA